MNDESQIAKLLRRERPTLHPNAEQRIRAAVLTAATRQGGPDRLSTMILVYSACGLVLLALATLGLAGVGPLAF